MLLLVIASPPHARAWGPHTEITRAALAVQADRARLEKLLGADWDRLARDYCWMGDWREAVRPDHYADDYLLFPAMPSHVSHMFPEVRRTYEPYFRRALQALRGESPHNAARWLGSFLHFVQDSGSPPHTTGIGGPLHGKMERWVDEAAITIQGYVPRLLGAGDDEALRGLQQRMDGLVEFSRARAVRLKPLVEGLTERVNQPLELECALETARVSADIIHTLLVLATSVVGGGCTLTGTLGYRPPEGYAQVPARILVAGMAHATTTDEHGGFQLRNLPPGKHEVWLLATGRRTERAVVELTPDKSTTLKRVLGPDLVPGNLVRNPTLDVDWLKPGQPDCWAQDPLHGGRWASALIRVPLGKKCRVAVEFQTGQRAPLAVRWRTDPSQAQSGRTSPLDAKAEIVPDPLLKPFEKGFLFLEVLIETPRPLRDVCRHIAVVFARDV